MLRLVAAGLACGIPDVFSRAGYYRLQIMEGRERIVTLKLSNVLVSKWVMDDIMIRSLEPFGCSEVLDAMVIDSSTSHASLLLQTSHSRLRLAPTLCLITIIASYHRSLDPCPNGSEVES
jgi:hypothetical protein